MARNMFKFVNTVGWKNDLESFRRLKKEVRGFKREIDNLYKGVNKNIPKNLSLNGSSYRTKNTNSLVDREIDRRFKSEVKREEDLYNVRKSNRERLQADQNRRLRGAVSGLTGGGGRRNSAQNSALADMLRQEETQGRLDRQRKDMIEDFLISNRELRKMSEEEKEILRTRLKQKSSVKELRREMRRIKGTLSDNAAAARRITREQERQNALARRASASYMQLGTSIASVYTALAAGQSIVRTGIAIESINKTLLSVTGNSTLAAEEMKFLEGEAQRLGLSLQDGGKAYAKLLAAGKGKLPTEDIRDMFTAVSEAGTVLGLSQDDMSGGIRAIQQMMSKGKIQAKLWPL